jgi:Xaa-Pro dipeptidase
LTYNIGTDELTLYIPPINPDSVIWSGLPLSPSEALRVYDVDSVLPTTDINATLAHSASSSKGGKPTVFAIGEQVSPEIVFQPFSETDLSSLKGAIDITRVVKDEYEVALLRRANDISAKAHIAVLRAAKSAKNECELEAIFLATCIANGCKKQSYHPIVASGTSAATLHYGRNDQDLIDSETKTRKLNLLLDAGCEYQTYCADITRTFPLSSQFTPESRQVYDIVLEMQTDCLEILKHGVKWEDVHALAHQIAIRGLLRLGILRGTEEELFKKRISAAFFPHGLGHYLGMDTHDTGGNPNYEDKDPMFKYLRLRGHLPAGSVVTVEPGVCPPFYPGHP